MTKRPTRSRRRPSPNRPEPNTTFVRLGDCTSVPAIPLVERAGHLRGAPFLDPAAGALLRLGDQEDLDRRVLEHDGADVAAFDDDAVR